MYAANLCDKERDDGTVRFVLDSDASNHFVLQNLEKHMSLYNMRTFPNFVSIHIANGGILKSNKLQKCYRITVEKGTTTISGKNFVIVCQNKNGLYVLTLDKIIHKNEECNMAMDEADMWHRKLCHAGKAALSQLGLKEYMFRVAEDKVTRSQYHTNEKRINAVGELIHSDICGPITPATFDGVRI